MVIGLSKIKVFLANGDFLNITAHHWLWSDDGLLQIYGTENNPDELIAIFKLESILGVINEK